MNKVYFLGELSLTVGLTTKGKADLRVGDRLVLAAVLDGMMGVETFFVGEAAADVVGDFIVDYLNKNGVDTKSVDRYTEGATAVTVGHSEREDAKPIVHTSYPAEPVNPIWPKFEEGDVVVYGGYMAIDERNHGALLDLLKYAKNRKAYLVYVPYFEPSRVPRITRVMPAEFECLEMADLIVSGVDDIAAIFPGEDTGVAFRDHILFYCRRLLVTNYQEKKLHFFDGDASWTKECHPTTNSRLEWCAGVLAGTTRALVEGMRDPDEIMNKANETAHSEIAGTV
ncbi:MAG: hypothetical protein K2K55_05065 [Duncaniella sp.]|nr:hypothetical protein [Duncaniella sp.]